jgi:glycosyltransferase involved in cell wall biosynthesis
VVIPAYNEEEYIEDCLHSLRYQTVAPFEVILVDNNCTDHTIDIAKNYEVTIIHERKQGMIHARDAGYNFAKGTIIARTDCDTRVPPDWIEKISKNFSENEIDGLAGVVKMYDLPLKTSLPAIWFLDIVSYLANNRQVMLGPNMALTRKMWHLIKDSVSEDETKVHEDLDVALNIYKAGGTVKRDNSLVADMSARRMKKNPGSFFWEYPIRTWNTIQMYK